MPDEPTPQHDGVGGVDQQPDDRAPAAADRAPAAASAEGSTAGKQLTAAFPNWKTPKVFSSALMRQFLRSQQMLEPMRRFYETQRLVNPMMVGVARLAHQHRVGQLTQVAPGTFNSAMVLQAPSLFTGQTAQLTAMAGSAVMTAGWVNVVQANLLIGSSLTSSMFLDMTRAQQAVAAATRFALRPTMPDGRSFDRVLHKLLLLAAEDARAQFLASGDPEAVSEFAFDWLGFTPSKANRDLTLQAVVDVVLSDEWRADSFQADVQTHAELRGSLRRTVSVARSAWQPLGEHRIARRRIGTLNLMVPGSETEVGELVRASDNVEALALGRDFTDMPRLQSLARLSAVEQEVCSLVGDGLCWADAAMAVGLPPTRGRAVQAKAKRRVREALTRQQARVRTTAQLVTT